MTESNEQGLKMQQPQTTAKPKMTSKARVLASLENAKKLVEQRKAALEAIEARERTKANRTPASVINKQKYLLGAYAMEKRPQVMKSAEFQEWLKRPQDRAIFGLEPLNKNTQQID